MIKLYQLPTAWAVPNPSQFCTKIETYLRMAGLPYETSATLPLKGPKGKLPYIEDNGKTIADSRFIIEYLKETYGDRVDTHLTRDQQAMALAMQRLLEEHFFWVGMYTRWQYGSGNWSIVKLGTFGPLPPVLRDIVANAYKYIIRKQIYGQGLGRLSAEEIFKLGQADLDAIADFLADKPYFMGDRPCSLDCSAFGFLVNIVGCPVKSPVKEYCLGKINLVEYCDRMKGQYFPELVA